MTSGGPELSHHLVSGWMIIVQVVNIPSSSATSSTTAGTRSSESSAKAATPRRYVALKILVSGIPRSTTELRTLRHIAKFAPGEEASRLLGEFEHHGPSGVHKCLVFEAMGPSVNNKVEEPSEFKPRRRDEETLTCEDFA
ncbi:kinase-like domain-containing protein [Penicillium paradoxum]|uniref:kinase-like domain-containing protein n=1 Tax=Penicillium paradoxum TaxID=176176 RepID=UPI0025471127|nr:kinase-like domain-containing protein [Penicillium paradoxum]KAJ5774717.1 kinase-like domain-containing protein [Penicillium paradoxum]